MFLLAELLFLFDCISDEFLLLPFVHLAGSVLIFEVKFGLLFQELLIEVPFGFLHKNLFEFLGMLLLTDPLLMVDFSSFGISLSVLVDEGLVSMRHHRLLFWPSCREVMLGINTILGDLIESLKELLVISI